MYTVQREVGRLDNINIGLVGDLANGRTARSLAYLLAKFTGVKIYFVAPDVVKMKVRVSSHFHGHNHASMHASFSTLFRVPESGLKLYSIQRNSNGFILTLP